MYIWHKVIDWLERRLNLSEIVSWITTFGISYAPLNSNQPVRELVREAFLKPLPSYQWPHILGLLTFVTFLLEVGTGFLLAFYFQPEASTAYESTRLIIRDTNFGWYVHQMHYWGAYVLLVLLLIRLLRLLYHRVYREPRELTWVFAMIVFVLCVQNTFTGELLPWNQRSYWATLRGLELLHKIPLVAAVLNYFVGGLTVDSLLLHRFYLLHVIFLPLLLFTFFYLNFSTVRRVGLSPIPGKEEKMSAVYPRHIMNLLIILLALFGGILALAVLFPSSFLAQADPFHTPPGISVSWYLLPLYGCFETFPAVIASWFVFVMFWILVLLPFVDRWLERMVGKEWILKGVALILFVLLLYFTYVGYQQKG